MTSREKVLEVERQVRSMIASEQEPVIYCPWCGLGTTPETGVLCCDNLALVVEAVLNFIDLKNELECVERVMERLDKVSLN